jgi:hypothetical protein
MCGCLAASSGGCHVACTRTQTNLVLQGTPVFCVSWHEATAIAAQRLAFRHVGLCECAALVSACGDYRMHLNAFWGGESLQDTLQCAHQFA